MAKSQKQATRRPATKYAHLQKKMQKSKVRADVARGKKK